MCAKKIVLVYPFIARELHDLLAFELLMSRGLLELLNRLCSYHESELLENLLPGELHQLPIELPSQLCAELRQNALQVSAPAENLSTLQLDVVLIRRNVNELR